MASTVMKEGQGTVVRDVTKVDMKKAKVSHFCENHVCLPRMGQIIPAFGNRAFGLGSDAMVRWEPFGSVCDAEWKRCGVEEGLLCEVLLCARARLCLYLKSYPDGLGELDVEGSTEEPVAVLQAHVVSWAARH